MFTVKSPGPFKTQNFLKKLQNGSLLSVLEAQGKLGVDALAQATPRDTGETANAWTFTVVKGRKSSQIIWQNTHTVNGEPMVILLQYGHGTGTGGYVAGRDFINPAMQPVFDKIAEKVWKEVMQA